MSFLINALTAVFGKPKTYNDGGITVFECASSVNPQSNEPTPDYYPSRAYHWRGKNHCVACSHHRVVIGVPQFEDFGHSFTQYICANCAKEMYGISRYLFNAYTEELPW